MTRELSTIDEARLELAHWLRSPPGRYLLAWEQSQLDRAVADVFGYHALQLGLPEIEALRANRMPHRWVASDALFEPELLPQAEPIELPPLEAALTTLPGREGVALHCDFDALPFPAQSLDLVVLPHALELARDPHDTLREVERVLMAEGRVVLTGFNPASLWGLRQRIGRTRRLGSGEGMFLPRAGDFIAYRRLRDWLRLLGFEVERGRFGCWRPPIHSPRWFDRFAWMESAGERWWPVFGAVYVVVAVKRVRGMRLVGLERKLKAPAAAPVAVARRQPQQVETLEQD